MANETLLAGLKEFPFRSEAIKLYELALKKTFQLNGQDKTQQIIQVKHELDRIQERLNNAQNMMLDKEIPTDEYRSIKSRFEPEIDLLTRKLNLINGSNGS